MGSVWGHSWAKPQRKSAVDAELRAAFPQCLALPSSPVPVSSPFTGGVEGCPPGSASHVVLGSGKLPLPLPPSFPAGHGGHRPAPFLLKVCTAPETSPLHQPARDPLGDSTLDAHKWEQVTCPFRCCAPAHTSVPVWWCLLFCTRCGAICTDI